MRRIDELDGLRGLAALSIAVFHLRFVGTMSWMNSGVDLFFVLSGFLITTILLGTDRTAAALGRFYVRRAWRIFPIYYLALGLVLLLGRALPPAAPASPAGLAAHLAYMQNVPKYWGAEPPSFPETFEHSWSLAIEEQFYLLWPAAVLGLGRRRLGWMLVPTLLLPPLARVALPWRFLLLGRADLLAWGALLALWVDRARAEGRPARALTARFVALGLLGAVVVAVPPPVWRALGQAAGVALANRIDRSADICGVGLLATAGVGLSVAHAGTRALAPLRARPLAGLGRVSYGLYVYHPLVYAAMIAAAQRAGVGRSLAFDGAMLAAAIGAAALSWHLIERPILEGRDRPRRAVGIAPGWHGPHRRGGDATVVPPHPAREEGAQADRKAS